jgi:iron complex transport system permease protein
MEPIRAHNALSLAVGLLTLLLTACVCLMAGRYRLSLADLRDLGSVWTNGPTGGGTGAAAAVLELRFVRIIGAMLVGAGLAVSGAVYQTVARSPLASPEILGVLSGAGFGAATALALGWSPWAVQALSLGCGVAAAFAGLGLARLLGSSSTVALVLAGLVISALTTSALSAVKYLADPQDRLPSIVYWLLGSLTAVDMPSLRVFGLPILTAMCALFAMGWKLDVLALDDDEARSLGVHVGMLRGIALLAATWIAAATVSMAGVVGWVGLLVPHLARFLVGARHVALLPMCALCGAIVLTAADTCARSLTESEIPLGILTELLGAGAFGVLLFRLRGRLQ